MHPAPLHHRMWEPLRQCDNVVVDVSSNTCLGSSFLLSCVLYQSTANYSTIWSFSCIYAVMYILKVGMLLFFYSSSFKYSEMSTAKIISAIVGSFAIAYTCDTIISDKKLFGGTTPKTITEKEWFEETDKKFQAWPRTAGPPVVMNPISRQNFIVKSTEA